MTPAAEITAAATALRDRTAAVPGFSEPLARLLEACAGQPGETGDLALQVAHSIRPPRRRTANRTEGNET